MPSSPKVIRKRTITSASMETTWRYWTTAEGVTTFFVPKATIGNTIGEPYELFFDLKAPKGFQGTEGCRILSFEPLKYLAFEFLAPPRFPNVRRIRSRVDIFFENVLKGGVVKVDLSHSGFLEGEEWDQSFDFFNWSWDLVLGRFQYRCSIGPIDWNKPYIPRGVSPRPPAELRDHIPP